MMKFYVAIFMPSASLLLILLSIITSTKSANPTDYSSSSDDSSSDSADQQVSLYTCPSLFITNGAQKNGFLTGRLGCRYIYGNVVITNIDLDDLNLLRPFLDDIRVIEGYLKIENVSSIPLNNNNNNNNASTSSSALIGFRFPQLQVIRGKTLLQSQIADITYQPALFLRLLRGINYVSFPALRAILNGDVFIVSSPKFGYSKTVEWAQYFSINLLPTAAAAQRQTQKVYVGPTAAIPVIPTCSLTCPDYTISVLPPMSSSSSSSSSSTQAPSMSLKRCFGPSDCQLPDYVPDPINSQQCRNRWECLGGCNSTSSSSSPSSPSQALASSANSYRCVDCRLNLNATTGDCYCSAAASSPSAQGNNKQKQKISYRIVNSIICTPKCPFPSLVDLSSASNNKCVLRCDSPSVESNGACVMPSAASMNKTKQPKECYPEADGVYDGILLDGNVDKLANCEKVVGNLQIVGNLLSYDKAVRYLSQVRTITGSLVIQNTPYKDLDFLSNLQAIEARSYLELSGQFGTLVLQNNAALVQIKGLHGVKLVNGGQVIIINNPKIVCGVSNAYAMKSVFNASNVILDSNSNNNNLQQQQSCTCSNLCNLSPPQFNALSCWASNDSTACFQCPRYANVDTGACLPADESCQSPTSTGYYLANATMKTCGQCSDQCVGGCKGPTAADCVGCRGVRRSTTKACADWCDLLEYEAVPSTKSAATSMCYRCHVACTRGCTGPSNALCSASDPDSPRSNLGCNAGCGLVHFENQTSTYLCVTKCPNGLFASLPTKTNDYSGGYLSKMMKICQAQSDRLTSVAGYSYCDTCSNLFPRCKTCQEKVAKKNGDDDADDGDANGGDGGGGEGIHVSISNDKYPVNCLECVDGFYLLSGKRDAISRRVISSAECVAKCPPGFVADADSKQCLNG